MVKPIEVGILTDSLLPDTGWGRYSIEVIRRLPEFGVSPVVLAPPQPGCDYPYKPTIRGPVHPLKLPFYLTTSWLRNHPIVSNCQIVHALVEHHAPLAALLAGRRPFLFNIYGTYSVSILNSKWNGPLMRWATRRAARIISISYYTERRMRAVAPYARTCTVHSGIDSDRFKPSLATETSARRSILSVGAVKRRKGHDVLLAAFSRIAGEFPDVDWVIVGSLRHDPHFVGQLQSDAERQGLAGRVFFKGAVSQKELSELYQTCYVFALAPRNVGDSFEGYPLVYGEANAFGKPAIATRENGSEETIENGQNGLLVNQNDADGTAKALQWFLAHPEETARMGMQGRAKVEQLTWERTARCIAERYEEVLARSI